jgi:serine/threonine protein kinase
MNCPSCDSPSQAPGGECSSCGLKFPHDPSAALGETKVLPESGVSGASPFAPGGLIRGHFEVARELGRGGMGVVYLVRDRLLRDKEFALKAISPALVDHPETRDRFVREVLAAQELAHESIIRVFGLDEEAGQPFFTMDYVPGRSLRELLEERKKESQTFSLEEANKIMQPVLSALEYAHSRRSVVVHRDVKPENIMVTGEFPDIQVKVLDFGLAKVLSPSRFTSSAMSMGTAYYMSPEQLAGQSDVDVRSDIYSTGVVLYELLTGKIPSGRFKLPSEIVSGLSEALDGVVDKVLQPEPSDRLQSALEMSRELEEVLAKECRAREEEERRREEKRKRNIREKEECKQLKREEEERKAREDAERAERERLEKKRKAREELEERERERLRREREESERVERERKAKEKQERKRQAQEEAERPERVRQALERLDIEGQKRQAREEAERPERERKEREEEEGRKRYISDRQIQAKKEAITSNRKKSPSLIEPIKKALETVMVVIGGLVLLYLIIRISLQIILH